MTWPDLTNAGFELCAGFAVLNHCRVLWRARRVEGVSATSTAFFVLWGFWNLYYYPSLGQVASFAAGILIVVANVLWLALMLRYRRRPGPR